MKMRQVNKIEKKKMEWYKLNLKILRFKCEHYIEKYGNKQKIK